MKDERIERQPELVDFQGWSPIEPARTPQVAQREKATRAFTTPVKKARRTLPGGLGLAPARWRASMLSLRSFRTGQRSFPPSSEYILSVRTAGLPSTGGRRRKIFRREDGPFVLPRTGRNPIP
jgi:hypothetical protein